jgi:prepilin peptidase CpaA
VTELVAAPWPVRAAVAAAAIALALSVVTDLRQRRIPNWVTLPALTVVVALFGAAGGWPLVQSCLLGTAVCALPLFVAAIPGWVGMGDVKLMAVCGAVAGFPASILVLVLVTVAGGVQAGLQVAIARLRGTARPTHVPYACSIAIGTFAAFLLALRIP